MDEVNISEYILENEKTAKGTVKDDVADRGELGPWPASASTLTQRVLHYLSTAENETLVIIIGALALVIYIIFGRLGLLLIGLVAGFLFHELWDGVADRESPHGERYSRQVRKRKELGIEVASRLLDWNFRAGDLKLNEDAENASRNDLNFSEFRPATAAALSSLTDAVVTEYVKYWYQPILPAEDSFPLSCRKTLVNFINSLSSHMTRKRSADTFLQFVTNSSSMIIVFLNELSLALETGSTDSTATEDVIKNYLKQYPESNLSNVLSVDQQQKKLKMVADDVLSSFLEPSVYKCEPLRLFFREILAGVVLESVIKSCSQQDFINGWIVHLLQEGEPEILNAIDASLENAPKGKVVSSEAAIDSPRASSSDMPVKLERTESSEKSHSYKMFTEKNVLPDESAAISSPLDIKSEVTGAAIPVEVEPSEGSNSNDGSEFVAVELPERSSSESKSPAYGQQDYAMLSHSLFGASVLIDDGSVPGDKSVMRNKPTAEYSLQIEPVSARQPGWMIFRSYQDFEYLHEGLSTLSRYHNLSFLDRHISLPAWRGQTKYVLAKALEKYLRDVLQYQDLVRSERVRRFLGRDSDWNQAASTASKAGLPLRASSTFENMGKGMLGVLSNAPKGVAGGGKAVLDGMTGVFAGLNKKSTITTPSQPISSHVDLDHQRHPSQDNLGRSHSLSVASETQIDRKLVNQPVVDLTSTAPSSPYIPSADNSADISTDRTITDTLNTTSSALAGPDTSVEKDILESTAHQDNDNDTQHDRHGRKSSHELADKKTDLISASTGSPITEDETRIAVELIFAVINELYTLSSAWNIRRTLLNAAKTYILRPGNPHLESMRLLVQQSMIDSHTSDEAIAAHVSKMRENALPTEEELKIWPPPLNAEESAKLKTDARKLLVERGMPQALMSVMGAVATGEALARVFDCLQIEEVGRGLMFALILQALRALIL
ncbi:PXA domain-containing protein [Talaromyces proteolyticus]|uniref:PXA domain-containing protein n=1 Tax=Talaromyces proteolyticus TaxID=1131652 RepID=A0AAD4KN76_9EURO|nr:PXA domain-containing protein [Talaromyces proteolyticus]KAH8695904.1 PXA domain-containing protein [Talaromyces proteolyticus]